MSTQSIDFKCIVEADSSPIVVFDAKGHILYLNSAAEILLGYVDKSELFTLATRYAPNTFGSKTTPVPLQYSHLSFYAVNVCYDCENWISIRLYFKPINTDNHKLDRDSFISTDINLLLDVALAMFKSEYGGKIKLMTDRDMPKFKVHQNNLSKLFRKVLNSFINSEILEISVAMGIGEIIIIDDERFQVIRLKFISDKRDISSDSDIEKLCSLMNIVPIFEKNRLVIDIPFIR